VAANALQRVATAVYTVNDDDDDDDDDDDKGGRVAAI